MATQTQSEIITSIPQNVRPNAVKVPSSPKKKLIRRLEADFSQRVRRSFQLIFLLWNVYLGATFYFWVRQFETESFKSSINRPAGVEGWLPIAGMMNFKYFLLT